MLDAYIVTVMDETGTFEADLEIPSHISLDKWKDKILDILKILGGNQFLGWSGCEMIFKGRALSDNETLAQAGAFEGSRLIVVRR
jgi:hypothetical protein